MKLLFDANVSPRLAKRLADLFPGSLHVFDTHLERFTSDARIWEFARSEGFTIVTADSDFIDLAKVRGALPFIVRLQRCSYRTRRVEELIRRHAVRIADLERSARAVLVIRSED